MGMFFTVGEKKIRPGVYQRYENRGTSSTAGMWTNSSALFTSVLWSNPR